MWPDRVVVNTPLFNEPLCFSQRVEDFSVEKFIAQPAVERFAVAVLPGASGLDVNGLCAESFQPLPKLLSELLLEFTGRHSGHAMSTLISDYFSEDAAHCFTSRSFGWWRNLTQNEPV